MADNLVHLLRGIAESKKSEWRGSFDASLDMQSSELHLGDEVAAIYHRVFRDFESLDDSRWYDPYHILFSTGFALRLVQALSVSVPEIELIVPAVLLHDIGYFAVQNKANWSGAKARIIHMQEGAARTARILWECAPKLEPDEVEKIVGMVAVHDNPYVEDMEIGEIPIRQAMRDCDRVWVMHGLSFYKDWHHKKEKYSDIEDFLSDRIVQFHEYRIPDSLRNRIEQNLSELVEKNQHKHKIEVPRFSLTNKNVKRLLERRGEEIDYIKGQGYDDMYEGLKHHRDYLEERIDGDFALVNE